MGPQVRHEGLHLLDVHAKLGGDGVERRRVGSGARAGAVREGVRGGRGRIGLFGVKGSHGGPFLVCPRSTQTARTVRRVGFLWSGYYAASERVGGRYNWLNVVDRWRHLRRS